MLIAATSPLLLLAVLACPIGMGLMMLFMGRGMMGGMKQNDSGQSDADGSSLAEMKAEQARLAQKIDTLEAQRTQPQAAEPETDREPDRVG
jgi:hypothetical protein